MPKYRGKDSEQGFTLIEMVVAVLIVAVMITVVTPRLISAGQRAETTACEQNQRNIRAALAEYDLLHGAYPTGDTSVQLQALVDDNILDSVPKEPSGGSYVINDIDANNVTVECSIHNQLGAP
ncbi:competence type IV pilus major pilin ComGC [Alicyclobacillus ferrooxydans]|uniref:Prepilin-type N-terminal cleavage/methylation domain-containing protein n=1 Tax=Alicyclobacillus ferrooxydans TaxID=471514 RepID=A0A0P9EJS1_9BACL|nr:prepilin-type N-terminal cleavage/methylation domain-containing protein [Alicyclobacillus ferrooxydans]KPV43241.1 hypothetical protein AN477_13390 [Alicyclobacillus ferrooxydans]